MPLTGGGILALEGLSALRLCASKHALHLPVRWYYVAENEGIAEWIMGGELIFVTGVNHPRSEKNLTRLLHEGKSRGIAGMVILTGGEFIKEIPPGLIDLANELAIPLIEQPYLMKMIIVTELIGTALARRENSLRSQRDILLQLLTGDYPDFNIVHQRAMHQKLHFLQPARVITLRLDGVERLFRSLPGELAEEGLQRLRHNVRQQLERFLAQQSHPSPAVELSDMFIFLSPVEEALFYPFKQQLQQWLQEQLQEKHEPRALWCGISAPVQQMRGYAKALAQARQAMDIAASLQSGLRMCDYQQLGFIKLLSAVGDPSLLTDFMQETLGKLIDPGRKSPFMLLETLEALQQENGNVVKAAERLDIHRNTLHQRVQRIETLTGYAINNPQFHLNASVALVIWRMSQSHLEEKK